MSNQKRASTFTSFLLSTYFLVVALVSYFIYVSDYSQTDKYIFLSVVLAGSFFLSTLYLWLALRMKPDAMVEDAEQQQSLFAELYQNSPVPYIRTNTKGEILDTNMAAVRLLGQPGGSLAGVNVFNHIKGSGKEAGHVSRVKQLVNAGTFVNDQEAILTKFDGTERWIMLSAFPYAKKTEILLAMVDITKQKNIETAKTEFVSLASHQLRTPVSSIKWNLELLASPKIGALSEVQQTYVAKLQRSAERMSLLIKDFLDASQLEMGTFATTISSVNFNEFIIDQMEEFEARVEKKGLQIDLQLPDRSVVLQTDAHLLRMSVNNLISNAVKYTPNEKSILITYQELDGNVQFVVRDNGMGIPLADQGRLFSKFYRATNVRTTTIEGTGVGLYIVKQAVEMMGGLLEFKSEEGIGTEFVVTLPISR